jgi:large repetitive protein
MDRRWNSLALVGALAACLWGNTAAVRADQVVLFTSDAGGGANCVRILAGGATTNYVTNDIVSVYHRSGNFQNGLLLFDLSSIPAGKTITKATLTLWHDSAIWGTGDQGNDTQVFRAAKPWVQWQVTWNRSSGYRTSNAVLWDIPGGDLIGITGQTDGSDPYGAANTGDLAFDDLANGPAAGRIVELDIDVTALVNEWYKGTSPNYGMLVTAPEPNGLHFHADRGDDPTLYPTLTVTFQ